MRPIYYFLPLLLLMRGKTAFCDSLPAGYDRYIVSIFSQDTIIKDIPKENDRRGGKQTAEYYYSKVAVEKRLGLISLENGFDSLFIRIWYGYHSVDTLQLMTLQTTGEKWSAKFYLVPVNPRRPLDSVERSELRSWNAIPKSGWKKFADRLLALPITTLPDMRNIPNYVRSLEIGGNSATVEVATKSLYRIYSYTDPGLMQSKFQQARQMEKILKLIREEFNFRQIKRI